MQIRLSQAELILFQEATPYDSAENKLNFDHRISIFSDNYPGISADEPIAVVYKPQIRFPIATSRFLKETESNSKFCDGGY